MQHKLFLTESAEAKLKQLGQSLQSIVYELLDEELPDKYDSPHRKHLDLDLPVLMFSGEGDKWFALAPGHPYTCSWSESYDQAYADCITKVNEIAQSRGYSKAESRIQQSVSRGLAAALSLESKAGVLALGASLVSMFTQYGVKDKVVLEAAYILACTISTNALEAPESAKIWAESNMLKYAFRTEAIEDFILEQCRL